MMKFITSRTFMGVFFSVLVTVFSVALFTYATTIGNAVSVTTTLTVTGASTLTGALTANGAVTLGDAAADAITVNGVFAGFVSNASSTISAVLKTDGLAVASSTPSQELGVVGSAILHETSGTTTLIIDSAGTNVGGCIQMRSTGGIMWRLYATTTSGPAVFTVGGCDTN